MSHPMDSMVFAWIWLWVGRAFLLVHFASSCILGVAAGFLSYVLLRWSRGSRSRDAAAEADIGPALAPKPESALRLISFALGWILLAAGAGVLPLEGFVIGGFAGVTLVSGPNALLLFSYMGPLVFAATLLVSARVHGRIVGGGDITTGLGNAPIARQWLVMGLAFLAAVCALVMVYTGYEAFLGVLVQKLHVSHWLYCVLGAFVVVVRPLSEELFLRGWLWTGLRRHWGSSLTALVTSGLWLVLYINWLPMR